jgi:hypothetical protein
MVREWYRRFLDREPDPSGFRYQLDRLREGHPPEDVLAGILGSDEYYRRAGGRPAAFVQELFLDLTGRPPTPAERQQWSRLTLIRGRRDVAHALLLRFPDAVRPGGRP